MRRLKAKKGGDAVCTDPWSNPWNRENDSTEDDDRSITVYWNQRYDADSKDLASTIGPNLGAVVKAGPALILQEFGNLGTAVLALPIAVFVFHMGRAAIGTSFSISRESSLAVVADKYGLDSDEGIGVMGGYITGTVFGTMFNGIFVSLLCSLNIFHPYALGMACGTGSASMLSASLAAVVEAYPDMEAEITAYAATSNMLSSVDGLYMSIFIALPSREIDVQAVHKEQQAL